MFLPNEELTGGLTEVPSALGNLRLIPNYAKQRVTPKPLATEQPKTEGGKDL
jgi:hypothetical protein